jgi:hypothetical protein
MFRAFLRPSFGELTALELLHMVSSTGCCWVWSWRVGGKPRALWRGCCSTAVEQHPLHSAHSLPPTLQDHTQQQPVLKTICCKSSTVNSPDDGRKSAQNMLRYNWLNKSLSIASCWSCPWLHFNLLCQHKCSQNSDLTFKLNECLLDH